MIRVRVLASVVRLALTVPAAAQAPRKKFMAAPVTIEDQGSFFIGGVTKVTPHAAIPFAPPGQPAPAPAPQQITIGQMYVQFQIPQRKTGPGWPVIMRSEEHTSELQSRLHLVCRLLLEKKKWPRWPSHVTQSSMRRAARMGVLSVNLPPPPASM